VIIGKLIPAGTGFVPGRFNELGTEPAPVEESPSDQVIEPTAGD